jgi:hypothetical protein
MKIKYTHLFNLIVLLGLFSFVQAQDFNNAEAYHSYILGEQARIVSENIHYITKSLHDHQARENETERKNIIKHIDEAMANINKMPAFKGDNDLKTNALDVFRHYKETFVFEFSKIDSIEINTKSDYATVKKYFDLQAKAEEKLVKMGAKFIHAQKVFIRKHNLKKPLDEVMCLFSKTAQLNDYSRQIYLAYLKVAEVNQTFFEAMKKKQTESMEKNRLTLIATADEAIATLEKLSHFDGNKDYLTKGLKLTHYIKNSASKEYVELVSHLNNKVANQTESMKFSKTIVAYNKQNKALLNDFNTASVQLTHGTVMLSADPMLAKVNQMKEQKVLSHSISSSLILSAESIAYETSITAEPVILESSLSAVVSPQE